MITLTPGHLTLAQLRAIARGDDGLRLDPASHDAIDAGAKTVADIAAKGDPAYGINTGFGRLANTHIPREQLELLQRNLVLSHAVGVGAPMPRPVVRLLIALKLSSLGRGHSGIRRLVMDALIALFNADVLPLIPLKGSVGASGDLAPLAHMSATLLGVGEVFIRGERASALAGLEAAGLAPLALQAKEGLALLNGTQACTAPHWSPARCRSTPPPARSTPSTRASTPCVATPGRSTPLPPTARCWKARASTCRIATAARYRTRTACAASPRSWAPASTRCATPPRYC